MSDLVDRLKLCSPYSTDGTMNSNMDLIREAAAEITSLRAENEALREDASKVFEQKAKLLRMDYNPIEGFEAVTASPVWGLFGQMIAGEFEADERAVNYLEQTIEIRGSPLRDEPLAFVITIRKKDGKTPGEIASEAKQQAATLSAEITRLRERCEALEKRVERFRCVKCGHDTFVGKVQVEMKKEPDHAD